MTETATIVPGSFFAIPLNETKCVASAGNSQHRPYFLSVQCLRSSSFLSLGESLLSKVVPSV